MIREDRRQILSLVLKQEKCNIQIGANTEKYAEHYIFLFPDQNGANTEKYAEHYIFLFRDQASSLPSLFLNQLKRLNSC